MEAATIIVKNTPATIIKNATSDSLLILDEIGRGTSTYDGMSIARAVLEYAADTNKLGAKTLFATHYHELTELESKVEGVKNYCIAVKEKGEDVIFLRKIIRGGADESYGIEVAKLSGISDVIINRAKEILNTLESNPNSEKIITKKENLSTSYTDFNPIVEELKEIDVTNLTPLDALNTLYRLQNKLKNRWSV